MSCYTGRRPKRRWNTRAEAKQALRRYHDEGLDTNGMHAYRCNQCGYFHLGHYPTNPTVRERLRDRHRFAVTG